MAASKKMNSQFIIFNVDRNNFSIRRASVASETLTGVKMKKSGMFVYLYISMDVRMSFCTLTLAFLC